MTTVADVPLDPKQARAIQRLADRIEADLDQRNSLIVEAHNDGASLREIAEHANMTHVAVMKIIKRTKGTS